MSHRLLGCFTMAVCAAAALLGVAATAIADENGQGAQTVPVVRTPHQYVYVVYWNPANRECLPGYQERLDRVMTAVQQWYADEMERNGFARMTFPLERDTDGKLVIHVVKSETAYAKGDRISTEAMREETAKPALLKEGIDIEQEHIIIFANSVFVEERDDGFNYIGNSAYCGGGGIRTGTAWVSDAPLLDPENLDKEEPMIYDGGTRPYTVGRYNVTYIGGVAHEFGHALGLPHNMETPAELEELGTALMGSGNYRLFGERAGMEKGAFLTKAHATILSSHPLFRRDTTDVDVEPTCTYTELTFEAGDGEYIIKGRVESTPRAYAVVAYHDLMQYRVDYDSTSWVGAVDDDGRFEVHVGALTPGWYEMRLRCFFVNGAYTQLQYRFTLNHTLKLPVEKLERQTIYEFYAKPAIEARDAEALLAAIDKLKDFNDIYYRRATAYYGAMTRQPTPPVELSSLGDDVHEVSLSSVKWASAEVGWDKPMYDHIEEFTPLESGEQFHEHGIYAHADSRYVYNLDGKWTAFTSGYGLQNLAPGSVVFIVKCDGQERFHSKLMNEWDEGLVDIDVTGVTQLELIVTDGGDGKWADCGIWFSPTLTR